jgi:hypothetical protein
MSTTTLNYNIGTGDPTLLSAVMLSDPTGTYGVKRNDTNAVVVAAGTAMIQDSPGVFHYTFVDPSPNLIYTCWVSRVYAGQTINRSVTKAGGGDLLNSYLQVADAVILSATMLPLKYFSAASASLQGILLSAATRQIDTGMRFQGRKYDLTQALQFPRVAYEASGRLPLYGPNGGIVGPVINNALPGGDVVWDWDYVNNVVIVPDAVKRATVYQADALANPTYKAVIDRMWSRLKGQRTGSLAEEYELGDIATVPLCRQAMVELELYRLRSGRML